MAKRPQNWQQAVRYFARPGRSLMYLASVRWRGGVVCPGCGSGDVGFVRSRGLWQCRRRHARAQFSVRAGTILEDSALALDKWLAAMWIVANGKRGVSARELHVRLGVTQKTAWYVLHRIRLALQDSPDAQPAPPGLVPNGRPADRSPAAGGRGASSGKGIAPDG